MPEDGARGADDRRAGWFLVAKHALPEDWQGRAIPVYLVPLGDDEVERLLPPEDWRDELDDEDRAVAELVAEGVPAHEIGARLHLSRRSVFRRLARLRHLTGSETNVQLATKLAKQDITRAFPRIVGVTSVDAGSYLRTQGSDASGVAHKEQLGDTT